MGKIPGYFLNSDIPKARWMEIGKAYKARLITLSRKLEQAKLFVYVRHDKHLIAYRDEQLTQEIGMLPIEQFEIFGHLHIANPPKIKSLCPIKLKYGDALDLLDGTEIKGEILVPENLNVVIETPEGITEQPTIVPTTKKAEKSEQPEQLSLF